jgi:predicted alpha/beta hydrolase family esterase
MAKQVLFVQGAGAGAHDEDAKLAASLQRELGGDYAVRYPRMPDEDSPDDKAWGKRVMEEVASMGDGAVIVGHSAGAVTVLLTILAAPRRLDIAGIFLIAAPFFGEGGWQFEGFAMPTGWAEELPAQTPLFLYHGQDDEIVPFAHVDLYAEALPRAQVRRLDGRNHQLNEDLGVVAADIKRLG